MTASPTSCPDPSASPSSAPATGAPTWSATSSARADADLRWVCDLDVDRARGSSAAYARCRSPTTSTRCSPTRRSTRWPSPRRPRTHAAIGARRASRPASTCSSRSRWPTSVDDGRKLVERGRATRGLVLMCDHTYCYTPAVQHIRELVARRRARRHPVPRLGAHQPRAGPARRRRALGPRARTTCRSSTSSCPPGRAAGRGGGARRRPDRRRPGLRRLPHAAARNGAHRPRPRQLAEPDQGAHDDRRRLAPHGRVGRPQPGAAPQRVRPGRRRSTRRRRRRGPARAR